MNRCTACGSVENGDEVGVCARCGSGDLEPLDAAVADHPDAQVNDPAHDPDVAASGKTVKRPRKRLSGKWWTWAAVALIVLLIVGGTAAALITFTAPVQAVGFDTYRPETPRVKGASPIATAIELSKLGWTEARVAVLIAEDDAAAAAVAGPIASKYGGPVLVTWRDGVPQEVLDELIRLKVTGVILLGAEGRFYPAVETAVSAVAHVRVITGSDDYALAGAVASDVAAGGRIAEVIVVPLSSVATAGPIVGGYSARFGVPVLFSDRENELRASRSLLRTLDPDQAVILGEATQTVAAALGSPDTVTYSATDPGVFAADFAEYAFSQGMEYSTVFVVRRADVAYAGALAPLAAKGEFRSSLLVVDDDALGDPASAFLNDHASSIKVVRFLGPGGTSAGAVAAAAGEAAATVISRKMVVVRDAATPAVQSFDASSGVLQLDAAALGGRTVGAGMVIVAPPASGHPGGLIRRVRSVQRSGEAVVMVTEQATLTDVVSKGSLDLRSAPSRPSSRADAGSGAAPRIVHATYTGPSAGRLVPASLPVAPFAPAGGYDARHLPDPVDVPATALSLESTGGAPTTFESRARIGAGVVIHATFVPLPGVQLSDLVSRVQDFEVRVVSAMSVRAKIESTVASNKVVGQGAGTVSKELSPIHLYTMEGAIGYVPVWADVVLVPHVSAGVTYQGPFSMEGTFTVDSQVGFKVVYDETGAAQMQPIAGMSIARPSWRLSHTGTLKAEAAVGARIALDLYSVVGPYVGTECFVRATGTSTSLKITSESARPSGGKGTEEFGFGLRPVVGGRFRLIEEVIDSDLGLWTPEDEQLPRMGLYEVLWSNAPRGGTGTPGLTFFDDSGNRVTVRPDGKRVRVPVSRPDSAVSAYFSGNIGVPSPDGRYMAWIDFRESDGDYVGLNFQDLSTGRWANATGRTDLEQTEWIGWSSDSRTAYFRSLDPDRGNLSFRTATRSVAPGAPKDLAPQLVADWSGRIGDGSLQRRLIAGIDATPRFKDAAAGSAVHVLTIQAEPVTGRLAFSTWFSHGKGSDGQFVASPEYDVWTADADGGNVKWVGTGRGPVWNAKTK